MIAGVLMFTVAGLLICGGLVGIVTSARGIQLFPERTRATGAGSKLTLSARHLVAAAVGVGVLLLTGWPVAGIAVAAATRSPAKFASWCLGWVRRGWNRRCGDSRPKSTTRPQTKSPAC
jgi:hypothetical protein